MEAGLTLALGGLTICACMLSKLFHPVHRVNICVFYCVMVYHNNSNFPADFSFFVIILSDEILRNVSLMQHQSLCHRNVHDHLPHGTEHHDPHLDVQANPLWAEQKDAP